MKSFGSAIVIGGTQIPTAQAASTQNRLSAIAVQTENSPPVAKFSYSPTSPAPGEPVTFDASESSDPDGEIVAYSWVTLTSGGNVKEQIGTAKQIEYTFESAGVYRIGLQVRDGSGATDQTGQRITVELGETQPNGGGWPQFQYDVANTGHAPDATAPTRQNLRSIWTTKAPSGIEAGLTSANGMLFFGTWDDTLYAVDTATGRETWSYAVSGDIVSTPAVVDGTVYIGTGEGFVYALDAATGSPEWKIKTDAISLGDERLAIYSSPTVVEKTVYLGTMDGSLFALNTDDGTKRWQVDTGHTGIASTPAVVNGTVYVGTLDVSEIPDKFLFHTEEETLTWKGADGRGSIIAFDTDDGTKKWSFDTNHIVTGGPAVANQTVYAGSWDQNVYALDAKDGSKQWEFQTGNPVVAAPSVANGSVYIGSYDNYIYALDATDGTERWRKKTGYNVHGTASIVGDTVYIGSTSGTVYALNTENGLVEWQYEIGWTPSTPVILDGVLYITNGDGRIFALADAQQTPVAEPPPKLGQPVVQRGFFTNGPGSAFGPLDDPFYLTVGGFVLSVMGMIHQLLGGR